MTSRTYHTWAALFLVSTLSLLSGLNPPWARADQDTTGVPKAIGGNTPATVMQSAPSCGFDPVQACQQVCACSCPGGLIVPATAAKNSPTPMQTPDPGAVRGMSGPGGPNAGGSSNFHSSGMFGYHRPAPLEEEPINYPVSAVDRPLILPNGLTEPVAQVDFFNSSINTASPLEERILVGAQTSWFADNLQVGAIVAGLFNTKVSFDSLFLTGQYGIADWASARLDLGTVHSVCSDGSSSFSGGLGMPLKFRLNPHLAIISGRPAFDGGSENWVTWNANTCGTTLTLGVPVGLIASLGNFNFALRSGYRHLLGSGASTDFVTFGADISYVIANQADIGVGFEYPGALGTPAAFDQTQTFWFEQRLYIYAQTRL